MTDSPANPVFKLPESFPTPSELADAWGQIVANAIRLGGSAVERAADPHVPQAYDPAAPARAFGAFANHLFTHPHEMIPAHQKAAAVCMQPRARPAARLTGATPEPLAEPERGDRRFNDPAWSE